MNAPAGWSSVRLGGNVEIYSGVAPAEAKPHAYGTLPYVKVEDLNNSAKYQASARQFTDHDKGVVPSGSVVFPKRGGAIMTNKVRLSSVELVMDTNLMALHPSSRIDAEFLFYALSHARLSKLADTSTIPQINNKHILPFQLWLPPRPEQRKIAEVLRAWDDAVERAKYLVQAETAAFSALRRQLFVSVGHEAALSEVSTRITTKTDGASHTVMAISAKRGFVVQAEKYRRDMAGANLANYTLLRRGEFAYNKGNSLTYPQGCIFPLKTDSALVPNVYYSFRLHADLNGNFYEHFFASGALNRQLAQRITSGVRGNGLLNLNADDFFKVRVPVPKRATQDAVAHVLNMGARKLELLQRKAELLGTQKSGLMQQLLTGQVRVDVAAGVESKEEDNE